jgi:ribulose-5-phosphate 4-epimerase/fuculose-1-phosphate aldolase
MIGAVASEAIEGAIQFDLEHRQGPLDPGVLEPGLRLLGGWRWILRRTGLIGRRPDLYGGAAFGNLSWRLDREPGRREFLITGTQTSDVERLTAAHVALVTECDSERNQVRSTGEAHPSSETLTHGALYAADSGVRAVLHAHSPEIWALSGYPMTDRSATCGTPEMAAEVRRLVSAGGSGGTGLLRMGGHEDGVLSWGPTLDEAGAVLLCALAEARSAGGPLGEMPA